MVDEVLWTGLGSAADAVTWFYSNPEWAILSDARYREVGWATLTTAACAILS